MLGHIHDDVSWRLRGRGASEGHLEEVLWRGASEEAPQRGITKEVLWRGASEEAP